jgi:hypothetical protein
MKLHPARLYVFDVLAIGERDVRGLPLSQRKELLRDSFDNTATLITPPGSSRRALGYSNRWNCTTSREWSPSGLNRLISEAALVIG